MPSGARPPASAGRPHALASPWRRRGNLAAAARLRVAGVPPLLQRLQIRRRPAGAHSRRRRRALPAAAPYRGVSRVRWDGWSGSLTGSKPIGLVYTPRGIWVICIDGSHL